MSDSSPVNNRSNRPHRRTIATAQENLEIVETDDGSRTLRRIDDHVTWHSESGALSESRLVFLENSQIESKFDQDAPVRILEIGFGTGLNFWLAASCAIRSAAPLKYFAIESELLDIDTIRQLDHNALKECQPAHDLFCDAIFEPNQTRFRTQKNGQVELTIASSVSQLFEDHSELQFDTVFLDPFAPDVSPQFWEPHFFKQLKRRMVDDSRLVTYCVKSDIQRRFKEVGFHIQKTRGPVGGKREVLVAVNSDPNRN